MKQINERTRRIDLRVPTGWNQCTKEQLEAVAGIILRRTMMQDRYHPYDPVQMKAEAFFALAGLEITGTVPAVSSETDYRGTVPSEFPSDDVGETAFMVRFRDNRPWWKRLLRRSHGSHTGDSPSVLSHSLSQQQGQSPCAPFPLAVWQVHSFIDQHLKWLDEFTGLQLFPYHDLGHYWRVDRHWPWVHRCRLGFEGELLDGMTWQQYRFAQEWLSYYVDVNGQLAQSRGQVLGSSGRNEPVPMTTLAAEAIRARTEFLRAVYRLPDGHYPRQLKRMSAERFQVILIWWQSMMAEMQRKYKRCFKSSSVNRKPSAANSQLPIDLYTRSTATLQKYLAQTEEQINQQPCRVILQHLDDMAREAEELEKINKSHRNHR